MQDILLPKDNEADLLKQAARLGYASVQFAYPANKKYYTGKGTYTCALTKPGKDPSIVEATPDTIRKLVEHLKPQAIHGLEAHAPKDYIHQRAGINHVIAKLMHANKVAYVIDLSTILKAKGGTRAAILGRMTQNIKVCQKYDVALRIASFARTPHEMRSPADLKSLLVILGMREELVRRACDALK